MWIGYVATRLILPVLVVTVTCNSIAFARHRNTQRADLLYHDYCSVCHGDHGDGMSHARFSLEPPPRDFTTPKATAELSKQRMIDDVTYGRPGTAMVSFRSQLSAKQIDEVVDYVRANFMKLPKHHRQSPQHNTSRTAPGKHVTFSKSGIPKGKIRNFEKSDEFERADMSANMPSGLAGDPMRGRALYLQNCSSCHGAKGNGKGPRAFFITPRPRDFLSVRSQRLYNRPTLFHAIANGKVGTVMPAWGKRLSDQNLADLVEFVFQEFIHPVSITKESTR